MHEAYSYVGPDGVTVSVPAARETPAKGYQNEPMTRAQAEAVMIAFGVVTGCQIPIRRRPNGAGYDAVVPMEFVAGLQGVRAQLDRDIGS